MVLSPISSVDRSAFRWLRTAENPVEFTLSSAETAVAQLRWVHPTGSLASVATAGGAWTLKRGGFLNPHITLRRAGAGEDLARLSVHLSSHHIEILGGKTYRFHRAGMLVPAWKVAAVDGQEILHVEPVREGRKLMGGAVLPSPGGRELRELLLLSVISWYFIVLAWFEDEALVPLEGPEGPGPMPPPKPSG